MVEGVDSPSELLHRVDQFVEPSHVVQEPGYERKDFVGKRESRAKTSLCHMRVELSQEAAYALTLTNTNTHADTHDGAKG